MESRTSRKSRFQIEKLEGRDVPSRLLGLLAVPAEGALPDRSGYEVQTFAQSIYMKGEAVAYKADIIAIHK